MSAQGNALGSESIGAPCKGAGITLRLCRAEEVPRTRSRGVAPGWHAPRRWRVNLAEFSIGETRHGPVYERGSSLIPARLEQAQRVYIHKDCSVRNFLLFGECE